MAFSGALTLTDLNDFITPAQACIKPVEQTNVPEVIEPGAASTEIEIDHDGAYYEVSQTTKIGAGKKLEQAQISLTDCLACSGCITSAESVLITLQSHTEVVTFLESNANILTTPIEERKIPVISISPQSLASLAASLSSSSTAPAVSLLQVLRRVELFCTTELGFAHVYDTTFARHVALKEHEREFHERVSKNRKDGKGGPMLASACPGWVCYAEKAHAEMLPFIARTKSPQQVMGTIVKEWLGQKWGKTVYHVSVMPCYDKKLEASRQDFYNETFSTRDVDCVITTGELELLMKERGWDISIPVLNETIPRTSSSFSTEIPELLSHPGTSSGSYLHSLIASLAEKSSDTLELSVKTIRSSDYEEYTLKDSVNGAVVFRGAKCYGFRNLQNVVRKVGRETGVQTGRGAAGRMVSARAGGGIRARARGAAAKDGGGGGAAELEKTYDYVEVMACPGGCVNGGGQLKPQSQLQVDTEGHTRDWTENGGVALPGFASLSRPAPTTPIAGADIDGAVVQNAKWGDKEWTRRVESAYWHDLPTPPSTLPPDAPPAVEEDPIMRADRLALRVLADICHLTTRHEQLDWNSMMDDEVEARRRTLFRTKYRAVESEIIGLAVKW